MSDCCPIDFAVFLSRLVPINPGRESRGCVVCVTERGGGNGKGLEKDRKGGACLPRGREVSCVVCTAELVTVNTPPVSCYSRFSHGHFII